MIAPRINGAKRMSKGFSLVHIEYCLLLCFLYVELVIIQFLGADIQSKQRCAIDSSTRGLNNTHKRHAKLHID